MALIYVGFPKSKQCLKYNTNSGDCLGDKKTEAAVCVGSLSIDFL